MFDFRGWRRRLPLLTLCLLLAAVSSNSADVAAAEPASISDVSLGIDGLMKPGTWTRVRVAVSGESKCRVEAVAADPLGNPVIYSSEAINPIEQNAVDLFIKPGRLQTSITVRVVSVGDDVVLDSRRYLSAAMPGSSGNFRVVKHSTPTALFCGGFSGGAAVASDGETAPVTGDGAALLAELREGGAEASRVNAEEFPTDRHSGGLSHNRSSRELI